MSTEAARTWYWPDAGPTPVNYTTDAEIFDTEKFSFVQTFVREAIQNSLDARHDSAKPVQIRFGFGEGGLAGRKRFLSDLVNKKRACGLPWPSAWDNGRISWLVVEDSNSSGLKGSLSRRDSDFWNYWLNFGISNKNGSGRGGRGIGRITFLIASAISTVIGVTRRASDGNVAACGMSLLKPAYVGERFKTSYAYLAPEPAGDIFSLYNDRAFFSGLADLFETSDYLAEDTSGLSLVIPYPHEGLTPDRIIAAAIGHFAPAILDGSLIIEAGRHTVDAASIDTEVQRVAEHFPAGPFRDDPLRVLDLIRGSAGAPDQVISVSSFSGRLSDTLDAALCKKLRDQFDGNDSLALAIEVPVVRAGRTTTSGLQVCLGRAPKDHKPVDLFFREGMCLPEVTARNPADVDLVVRAGFGELATYLNFCEGKAHLDLYENEEVKAKLTEQGFSQGVGLKRFVKRLMDDLRAIVLPDASKPDASVFSSFFAVPKSEKDGKKDGSKGHRKPDQPAPPNPDPAPARERVFLVDELDDGFRIRGNPSYAGWPVKLRAEVAYADGSRRPRWSRHDFQIGNLAVQHNGSCAPVIARNVISCSDCDGAFSLEVRGFDRRRELVTNIRAVQNA